MYACCSTLDWRTQNLDSILGINQTLPLDIVGTNFAIKLVPTRWCQYDPSTVAVLVLFHNPPMRVVVLGVSSVGAEKADCGEVTVTDTTY